MKYNMKVGGQVYVVEIENINARPVIAFVDGERFEVMPELSGQVEAAKEAGRMDEKAEAKPVYQKPALSASLSPNPALSGNALIAPLPGTIVEVFVRPGEKVEAGQVVCLLEAMKMKNPVRTAKAGTVAEICVSAGQTVCYGEPLVRLA